MIGGYSCANVVDLPSLTLLSMGKNSFKYASHVQFESMDWIGLN